jgi:hypothetical protein
MPFGFTRWMNTKEPSLLRNLVQHRPGDENPKFALMNERSIPQLGAISPITSVEGRAFDREKNSLNLY